MHILLCMISGFQRTVADWIAAGVTSVISDFTVHGDAVTHLDE